MKATESIDQNLHGGASMVFTQLRYTDARPKTLHTSLAADATQLVPRELKSGALVFTRSRVKAFGAQRLSEASRLVIAKGSAAGLSSAGQASSVCHRSS